MKKVMKKLNNRGATLILVIISLLFVGIIAAVVLTLTTTNVKNIFNASQSSSNFYSAEKAVDAVRAKFQENADKAAREAYTQWLEQYSFAGSGETDDELFQRHFAENLVEILTDLLYPAGGGGELIDISTLLDTTPLGDVKLVSNPSVVTEDGKVKVKNLSIQCTDSDGTVSVITTDIVFDIMNPSLAANRVNFESLPCASYVVITDEQLRSTGTVKVTGNVYGGGLNTTTLKYTDGGIYVSEGGNLTINADYVLSRNAIRVEDNAKLNVSGLYPTGVRSYCKIWAKNLDLVQGIAKGKPEMTVRGDCYLSDDLTLDADSSKFSMEVGSSFYGYNTSNATIGGLSDAYGTEMRTGTPEGSSAIVINGKNSTVDLSGAEVWIAGKTFVSVPSHQTGDIDSDIITASFIQGESLSYRALQPAYLLPGECVVGIGHNPMTYDEFRKVEADGVLNYYIDTDKARENGNVDINLYINNAMPYRRAYVQYKSGNTNDVMVYLYLNFISANAAAEYFSAYYAMNEDLVIGRMKQFGSMGQILVNPLHLTNTGNVVTYDEGGDVYKVLSPSYDKNNVEYRQISYATTFKALTTSLDEKDLSMSTATYLTDNIVDFSTADSIFGPYTGYKVVDGVPTTDTLQGLCAPEDGSGQGCKIAGIDCKLYTGSHVVINTNSAGIIVCSGDVDITAEYFYGLIIARGKVNLAPNTKIINSQTVEYAGTTICDNPEMMSPAAVIKYIIQNEETVKKVFKITDPKDDEGDIYTSDLISLDYSNWRKE